MIVVESVQSVNNREMFKVPPWHKRRDLLCLGLAGLRKGWKITQVGSNGCWWYLILKSWHIRRICYFPTRERTFQAEKVGVWRQNGMKLHDMLEESLFGIRVWNRNDSNWSSQSEWGSKGQVLIYDRGWWTHFVLLPSQYWPWNLIVIGLYYRIHCHGT